MVRKAPRGYGLLSTILMAVLCCLFIQEASLFTQPPSLAKDFDALRIGLANTDDSPRDKTLFNVKASVKDFNSSKMIHAAKLEPRDVFKFISPISSPSSLYPGSGLHVTASMFADNSETVPASPETLLQCCPYAQERAETTIGNLTSPPSQESYCCDVLCDIEKRFRSLSRPSPRCPSIKPLVMGMFGRHNAILRRLLGLFFMNPA